jgi:hypothetical protein
VAEILRPEVTEIVRMPFGLLLLSATPNRSLFVSRAFDGFADVSEALKGWKPMREMRGMAAWGYATRAARREGPRDAVLGTALATDASLVAELDSVRAASLAARANSAPAPIKRRGWAVGLTGVLGFIVFLAIWQVLQPSERKVFDCKSTCRYTGACVRVGDRCVADSDDHCAGATMCASSGHCKAVAGRCVAGTDGDCGRSEHCGVMGKCKAVAGECVVSTDADCKVSSGCRERGLCTAAAGMCVAGSDDECRRSGECTRSGACRAAAGACVAN